MNLFGKMPSLQSIHRRAGVEVRERDGVRTLHLGSDIVQSAMRLDRPDALELAIVLARRPLANRLKKSEDWDGATAVGRTIGQASEVDRNRELETYRTVVRFGNPRIEADDNEDAAP